MPIPKRILIAGLCLSGALTLWGLKWVNEQGYFDSTPNSLKTTPVASAATTPRNPETPAPEQKAAQVATLLIENGSGNLGALSDLRAELEELKLHVAIEEQAAKLRELQTPKAMLLPPMATSTQELLAALTPPTAMPATNNSSASANTSVPLSTASKIGTHLVGIQGSGVVLTASVDTGQGERLVNIGDHLLGSKVKNITQDGITLANGKSLGWDD